jgi:hypothetical protein
MEHLRKAHLWFECRLRFLLCKKERQRLGLPARHGFSLVLLDMFQSQGKRTDVRDQIYGLLGLAAENLTKVDYGITFVGGKGRGEDLYIEVLLAISKESKHLKCYGSPNFQTVNTNLQRCLCLDETPMETHKLYVAAFMRVRKTCFGHNR